MKLSEAWEKWPEHRGHRIGASLGNVVCATCGYVVLERDTQPFVDDGAVIHPYWTS